MAGWVPALFAQGSSWVEPSLQRDQAEVVQEILGAKSNIHPISHRHPSSIPPAMWARRFAHLGQ